MKKALLVLLVVGAAVYVASWFWAGDEVAATAARPWPEGMGTLDAVPGRYPPRQENEAARNLGKLAARFAGNDAVTAYVRREIARGELAIAEPPKIADVSAIRELLLREPVEWERNIASEHGGLLPKVAMFQSLMRVLITSALGRARRHEAAAWDDLHAVWNLTKSLDGQPHRTPRLVALSMARAVNAIAWKMPLPVPAWFGEVRDRDFVRPLCETMQCEDWWKRQYQIFLMKPLARTIDRDRTLAGELARMTDCEFQAPRASDVYELDITWQRAFRFRAEREATANALRARAGQPVEARSRCSDGGWSFDRTTLRFAKPIALVERIDTSMPLTLRVGE